MKKPEALVCFFQLVFKKKKNHDQEEVPRQFNNITDVLFHKFFGGYINVHEIPCMLNVFIS